MKIAVVGSGIAGNVVARRLHEAGHDISVFEGQSHIGGHTHTHAIEEEIDKSGVTALNDQPGGAARQLRIDTGFIVFNDWTYPNFIALLNELGVESQASSMSFSVRNERSGLEYNGTNLNGLFAQRRNLLRPAFLRMIRDILRFNREAPELLGNGSDRGTAAAADSAGDGAGEAAGGVTLGRYLQTQRYSPQFINDYLIPMGAAIWSTDPQRMMDFPAAYLVRFFSNHGMLSVDQRPMWRVVKGGSDTYVDKLIEPFRQRIRINTPVESVLRTERQVIVRSAGGHPESFDQVFFACHSDQALALLENPSPLERAVLGAIPYQRNEAVLHTDTRLLPRKRAAWAAWNYHVRREPGQPVALTYDMNILQGLESRQTYCVTLNHNDAIDPSKVIKRMVYDHPLFTREGVAAQRRQGELNGRLNTYYCGAYWRYGFHEDGVISALQALQHFRSRHPGERRIEYAQRHLSRVD